MNKKHKCLVLMSGGLDSMLSAKILKEAGMEVTPLCFKSYFFGCESAEKASKQIGMKLRVVDFSKEHLKMLKNPKYGRGSAINPCVDCHLLMIKEAGKIMKKEKYDFVATGEVLGQRPMSQNFQSLSLIEKQSGLSGLIVRPLSLKVLPPTVPEKKGIIDREDFYGISGRGRYEQIALAKKFGIKDYPSPAGGCILTDKNYAINLKKLFEIKSRADGNDCLILRQGRVFFNDNMIIVVARNQNECSELSKLGKKGDVVLEPHNFAGPTVLIRKYKKSSQDEMINCGISYVCDFSKDVPDDFILKLLPSPESL
ncbi:MAG: tRNA 4-thiouridine(8) synthase ThiI [Candidatus Pacebacteria bacterium]|nr:tRNA 4-thiouridine(8) synthase ThiI [Candidatus Paceibacterota bacterium]